mmetsp:Transcript_16258/g.33134  ORF Transcript_16258/g.33134 Transcript_16258/m.33134 type:complete len:388 (+) Transcript_16258:197-1360(+)
MAETPKKDTKSDPSSDVTYPIMSLASRYHLLTHCSKSDLEADLKAEIKDIKAVHLWEAWGGKLGWGEVTAEVKKAYDEEEQGLKDELKKAEESSGETEILDAYFGLSNFYSRTGSLALSLSTLDSILSLPKLSTSKKIHALLGKARVLMFFDRSPTDVVAACDDAAEKGGDWDKRNRLKVYKALDAVSRRDFKKAAELLAGCVKTFSADELVDFKEFCTYTVLLSVLHMPRPSLKKDVIDGPEILAVVPSGSPVRLVAERLYDCDYSGYFRAVAGLEPSLRESRYMSSHASYLVRELVVLGYAQFLQSYKSCTLAAMAETFAVPQPYLDAHLSRFIAAGRLQCKIDKVGGVVETVRADGRNAQYKKLVEEGDKVLNKLQRLSRVVDV